MKTVEWLCLMITVLVAGKAVFEWFLFKSKKRLLWDIAVVVAMVALFSVHRRG
jgi:hypothetical protein